MQYYLSPLEHDYGYGYCDSQDHRRTLPKELTTNVYRLEKYDNRCYKPLSPPYYVVYLYSNWGILHSDPCMNPEDEAIQTMKIVEFIKYKYKQVSGTNRDDYIDREIRGKKRYCRDCFEKLKKDEEEMEEERRKWDDFDGRYFDDLHKEEMERMNKPIESYTTDLERYMISLPDRSDILKESGYDPLNRYHRDTMDDLFYLHMDMQSIFKSGDDRHDGIITQDKNRIFPNEQVLTAYMQKNYNSFPQVQYCKIFDNGITKIKHYPKFTIIIHFSEPKGYWMEFEAPGGCSGYHISNCISSRFWVDDGE
jgi:hypothetical protein